MLLRQPKSSNLLEFSTPLPQSLKLLAAAFLSPAGKPLHLNQPNPVILVPGTHLEKYS